MSLRSILLVAAALILTVGTVFFARGWLEDQRNKFAKEIAPAPQVEAPEVLVATDQLPVGIFLKRGHMRWQKWPDDSLPPSYLLKDKVKEEDLYGTVVRRTLSAGQPVTMDRIIRPGDRGFLAAVLQAGYRAVSIPIGAASGIAGLIFPGDRVDIILSHTLQEPDEEDEKKTIQRRASETVLTNVRVLALDQKINDENGEPKLAKTATLEVTPKQAEILAVVRELGSLSLSLRSLANDEIEMQRLVEGGAPMEGLLPEKGETHTWDSEASQLVESGEQVESIVVKVSRGKETEEVEIARKR